jgi:hypothetical protein
MRIHDYSFGGVWQLSHRRVRRHAPDLPVWPHGGCTMHPWEATQQTIGLTAVRNPEKMQILSAESGMEPEG